MSSLLSGRHSVWCKCSWSVSPLSRSTLSRSRSICDNVGVLCRLSGAGRGAVRATLWRGGRAVCQMAVTGSAQGAHAAFPPSRPLAPPPHPLSQCTLNPSRPPSGARGKRQWASCRQRWAVLAWCPVLDSTISAKPSSCSCGLMLSGRLTAGVRKPVSRVRLPSMTCISYLVVHQTRCCAGAFWMEEH